MGKTWYIRSMHDLLRSQNIIGYQAFLTSFSLTPSVKDASSAVYRCFTSKSLSHQNINILLEENKTDAL